MARCGGLEIDKNARPEQSAYLGDGRSQRDALAFALLTARFPREPLCAVHSREPVAFNRRVRSVSSTLFRANIDDSFSSHRHF